MMTDLHPDARALLAGHLPHLKDAVLQFARVWEAACDIDPAAAAAFGDTYPKGRPDFEALAHEIAGLALDGEEPDMPQEAKLAFSARPLFGDGTEGPTIADVAGGRGAIFDALDDAITRFLNGIESEDHNPEFGDPELRYSDALDITISRART
jgi:hypothetical protein